MYRGRVSDAYGDDTVRMTLSEWSGWARERWREGERDGRKAAMFAYVTFRMTLAGHTGLLPHQFSRCPRGHHITHTHISTLTTSHSLSPSLSLSFSLSFSSPPPAPGRRGSTWPNTPAASDWLPRASNTPPAPQPARLCLETGRLCCYHHRPLLQHRSANALLRVTVSSRCLMFAAKYTRAVNSTW